METSQYDEYDRIICKKILDVIIAVKSFLRFNIADLNVKKDLGIILENEMIDYIKNTQEYYNSLCTKETEILGLTTNNISFEKVYGFSDKLLAELYSKEYKTLKPYLIKTIIDENTYINARNYFKQNDEKNNKGINIEQIAIKSGYYFDIFDKRNIPDELKKSDYKVKLNGIIYDLYEGATLEQERMIDSMFGDNMGYAIDDYKIINLEEEELDEP